MTTTYNPESTTYAWSESGSQYGRPYISPEARPGWYDGYRPMDRANRIAAPDPVSPSGNSASVRKAAVVAGLLAAVGGGALLGAFVFGNSGPAPNPSVYVVPETSGAPAAPPAPEAAPPAQGGPNTIVVPGNGPATTVVVPPPRGGPAPAAVPAPLPPAPAAPRPANVPPPPPRAPVAPPQVRIEGIPIPIPMPGQTPPNEGQNNQDQQQQQQQTPGAQQDECTMVPDLPYCKKPDQSGTSGGGASGGGGTSGGGGSAPAPGTFDPAPKDQAGSTQLELPPQTAGTPDPGQLDPDKLFPKPPCILGVCP